MLDLTIPVADRRPFYTLEDFQKLHMKAIDNPLVSQAELEAFAYIHTQALMDQSAGFYASDFDDDMAKLVASYGPPTRY